MNKKIILGVVVVAVVVVGVLYATRPPSSPTEDIQSVSDTLNNDKTPGTSLYRISQEGSKIEFKIGEILNGSPFTAVGTTNQVAGDIIVSNNPAKIEIGTLKINAKTFKTDSSQRDGAIARFILKSEEPANEFIEFKPTGVIDLAGEIKPGMTFDLNVAGNLTVSGVTKPAVFSVSMKINEGKVIGTAGIKIKRSDYGLVIPNIPFVASVDDEFTVTADIVANLQ
jgi:polyisoprenoid-binding protein YceI